MASRSIRIGRSPVELVTHGTLAIVAGTTYLAQPIGGPVRFAETAAGDPAPVPETENVSFAVAPETFFAIKVDASTEIWVWTRGTSASLRVNEAQ